MHKYIENYINNAEWDTPGSNPIQQAFKMAQTVYDNALKDVNEIWGSEVSLYFPKYMQVPLTVLENIKEHLVS